MFIVRECSTFLSYFIGNETQKAHQATVRGKENENETNKVDYSGDACVLFYSVCFGWAIKRKCY